MAQPLVVTLTETERDTLSEMCRHHPKPYLRERAAALLKIADGASGRWVARHGLLQPRSEDSVYGWVHRYATQGLGGLYVRDGRGRKPAFFPSAPDG